MKKKLLSFLMLAVMVLTLVTGCGSSNGSESQTTGDQAANTETGEAYHIAIVTPTLSISEDEYRAGEEMAKKYPDIVKHLTLPENFSEEIETGISTIVSAADDPLMKAVIIASGQSGLIPAMQQIKEKNPEILTISAAIYDETDQMAENIDLNLDTDQIKRGSEIAQKAYDMGAKTFIHYSFPTHLSKPLISGRKDAMKAKAEELGMTWVEVETPDPQTGDSREAMQQFLREDIPRQIEKYGPDTNIFGTNCPMYDVIIDEAFKLKYMVAEQCCPTPTQAYPTVLGLEISEEDSTNWEKLNQMITEKAAAADMTGRLSGWPMSTSVFLPEMATYIAMEYIEDNGYNYCDTANLQALAKEKFGYDVEFAPIDYEGTSYDNYIGFIMESIYY